MVHNEARSQAKDDEQLLQEVQANTRAPQNQRVQMNYEEMNQHVKEQLGFMIPRVVEAMTKSTPAGK